MACRSSGSASLGVDSSFSFCWRRVVSLRRSLSKASPDLSLAAASMTSRSLAMSASSLSICMTRVRALLWRFTSELASSMRSMALSGRKRSVMYRSDIVTARRHISGEMVTWW